MLEHVHIHEGILWDTGAHEVPAMGKRPLSDVLDAIWNVNGPEASAVRECALVD